MFYLYNCLFFKTCFLICELFCKARAYELNKLFDCLLFIRAAGDNANLCTAHYAQRKYAEQAFCVDSSFVLLYPYR